MARGQVLMRTWRKEKKEAVEELLEQVVKTMWRLVAKILASSLHNDKCIKILKNCKEVISEYGTAGKVIIVDVIEVNGGDKLKDVGLILDMVMLTHTNMCKERTAEEWTYVLSEAGFTRHTIKNIQAVSSVIEAYP